MQSPKNLLYRLLALLQASGLGGMVLVADKMTFYKERQELIRAMTGDGGDEGRGSTRW